MTKFELCQRQGYKLSLTMSDMYAPEYTGRLSTSTPSPLPVISHTEMFTCHVPTHPECQNRRMNPVHVLTTEVCGTQRKQQRPGVATNDVNQSSHRSRGTRKHCKPSTAEACVMLRNMHGTLIARLQPQEKFAASVMHTRSGLRDLKEGSSGMRPPVAKPSWRQATRASVWPKLAVQTAPQAHPRNICRVPVANPLTSTLLINLSAPSVSANGAVSTLGT